MLSGDVDVGALRQSREGAAHRSRYLMQQDCELRAAGSGEAARDGQVAGHEQIPIRGRSGLLAQRWAVQNDVIC